MGAIEIQILSLVYELEKKRFLIYRFPVSEVGNSSSKILFFLKVKNVEIFMYSFYELDKITWLVRITAHASLLP